MITTAKIIDYTSDRLILCPSMPISQELIKKDVKNIEIRIDDGRIINAEQRKKAYALLGEIAKWSGHFPGEVKEWLKFYFLCQYGKIERISLSDCTVTDAREFINFLIDFCLRHSVPCKDSLANLTDDIDRYIYQCLINKKCCVTGKKAEFHHCTGSKVGMGRNRQEIAHLGAVGMPLSREMHDLVHIIGEESFFERYYVYGIKIDEEICKTYQLKTEVAK